VLKLRARRPRAHRIRCWLPVLSWRTSGILPYLGAPASFERWLGGRRNGRRDEAALDVLQQAAKGPQRKEPCPLW